MTKPDQVTDLEDVQLILAVLVKLHYTKGSTKELLLLSLLYVRIRLPKVDEGSE